MTKLEQQQTAISAAVRMALYKMGVETLATTEFFGTNQRIAEDVKKAA